MQLTTNQLQLMITDGTLSPAARFLAKTRIAPAKARDSYFTTINSISDIAKHRLAFDINGLVKAHAAFTVQTFIADQVEACLKGRIAPDGAVSKIETRLNRWVREAVIAAPPDPEQLAHAQEAQYLSENDLADVIPWDDHYGSLLDALSALHGQLEDA